MEDGMEIIEWMRDRQMEGYQSTPEKLYKSRVGRKLFWSKHSRIQLTCSSFKQIVSRDRHVCTRGKT